jgi:DNA-binding transcriptional LysR family regulator
MNLSDLAIFVEAVRVGSLAGAARRLGLNAMAASRRLAGLEAQLGVRLVHRTTRSLAPTAEGEAFLPHAQAMLDEQASALAALRRRGRGFQDNCA